jgi:manganese/zinc/iron transport system permease protein
VMVYVAALFLGLTLSLSGRFILLRRQVLWVMCLAQAASCGFFVAAAFFGSMDGWEFQLATLFAVGMVVITVGVIAFLSQKEAFFKCDPSQYLLGVFLILICVQHLVAASSSSMQLHVMQRFMGDLATLDENKAALLAFIAVFTFIALIVLHHHLLKHHLRSCLLQNDSKNVRKLDTLLIVLFLLVLVLSVEAMGLVFTLSFTHLPALIFLNLKSPSQRIQVFIVASVSGGIVLGFLLNELMPYLPTAPLLVLVSGCLMVAMRRFANV